MGKAKKQFASNAPWRGDDDEESNKFQGAKLKLTNNPGSTPTMHVPRNSPSPSNDDDDSLLIDPELRYSFQRNLQFSCNRSYKTLSQGDEHKAFCEFSGQGKNQFLQRVFSIDTIVKPLPPAMAYNVSRNLSFFTRIFTQFFDPEGIANAQKSLGIGQEEKVRRVR